MISAVTPDQVDFVWPMFLPMVEKGLRHGQGDSITPIHLLQSIKSEEMDLWLCHEGEKVLGGMILKMSQHPAKKNVFVVMLVGKNFDEWVGEAEEALIAYKDINGADTIEASCRNGMVKKLSERGWKKKAVIMEAP